MTHVEDQVIDIRELLGPPDMTRNKDIELLDAMAYLGIHPIPLSIPTPEEIEERSRRNYQKLLDSLYVEPQKSDSATSGGVPPKA